MTTYYLNGSALVEGADFIINGFTYPYSWLEGTSPSVRASLGIEVTGDVNYDPKYYYDSGIVRPLDDVQENDEKGKYLMTFQNFISQIPKWSKAIVQKERERIVEKSGCNYLEDLIACVHIVQLKALSCIRVGQKQKKIDIDIPSLDTFIHNVYINCARKVYTNVYLFEIKKPALEIQRNNRDLEVIVKECLMDTIRESVPVDKILRAYMDETEEQDVETHEEVIEEPAPKAKKSKPTSETVENENTENSN